MILLIREILNFPNVNFVIFIVSVVLIPVLDYLMLLSPYQQYTENYYIEFPNENSFEGFKLFYRKKEVFVAYKVDKDGKFVFSDENKLNCVSYVDGAKMSNLTKRRIINYFTSWMRDNDLS